MRSFIASLLLLLCCSTKAVAADAYWLDQHNALWYLFTGQLDAELREMQEEGSKNLLLHSDSLPPFVSRFIAWRAKAAANMNTVAWIQKPTRSNLLMASQLQGVTAVQIDDHYFNDPPVPLSELRSMLGQKRLWCSFQPRQFSHQIASACDHSDVQIYRQGCMATGDMAWNMGITGYSNIKVAAYHDGSNQGTELINCIKADLNSLGTGLFVFKWKNQEAWLKHLFA